MIIMEGDLKYFRWGREFTRWIYYPIGRRFPTGGKTSKNQDPRSKNQDQRTKQEEQQEQ